MPFSDNYLRQHGHRSNNNYNRNIAEKETNKGSYLTEKDIKK